MNPLVTAIITTCARPRLVVNAVRSALAQTLGDIEVIVVIDGPDRDTESTLHHIDDARIRVHVRGARGGQGAAINSGIALARGEWIALLDDDDEWLPAKLETQLSTAEASPAANPLVICRFIARSEAGDTLWPRRAPRGSEPVCEYLFCRRSFSFGEGVIPTSVIFARTALFRSVRLNERLRRHADLDWLIRSDRREDVKVEIPSGASPLAIWHMQRNRPRMSNAPDWRDSCEWLDSAREVLTPRAYAGFLLTWASSTARRQRALGAFSLLLRRALGRGRPRLVDVLVHLAIWSIPVAVRTKLSRTLAPSPPGPSAEAPR